MKTLKMLSEEYHTILAKIQSLEDEALMFHSSLPTQYSESSGIQSIQSDIAHLFNEAEPLRLNIIAVISSLCKNSEHRLILFDRLILNLPYAKIASNHHVSTNWARQLISKYTNTQTNT